VSERTILTAADGLSLLGRQWHSALTGLCVWHPNGQSGTLLHLSAETAPVLRISLDRTLDTHDQVTPMRSPFVISCVRLTFFPGEWLARMWLAAAWAGYAQHEALELVTFGGIAVLDPHREPYSENPWNRGLRAGFPPVLSPETLVTALAVVMPEADARKLAGLG
jgi:hypothetical protein